MNREAVALLRRGIDIDNQATVIEADNYFRSFIAYRLRLALAKKLTNIKINEAFRPLLRDFQAANGGDNINKEMFELYAEELRNSHRGQIMKQVFESTCVIMTEILSTLNGLDAQLVNRYEEVLLIFEQEDVLQVLEDLVTEQQNPAFQDLKNPLKTAKAYLNLLKSAAVKLGMEPIKMGSKTLEIDRLSLRRFVEEYASEVGSEINDDDVVTLIHSSLSTLIGLAGKYELDHDTTQQIALAISKIIVLSRKPHPDNPNIHQIVMPTGGEISNLIEWIIKGMFNGNHMAMTTVCPDYDYEVVNGIARFTGKGLGDEIGLVGTSIMNISPQIIQILEDQLGINLNWNIGYAKFEATEQNAKSNGLVQQQFINKLDSSANRMSSAMGREVGLFPESLTI